MASPLPVLRLPLPTPLPFPSSSVAAQKPNTSAALPRSTVQWPMPNQCLTTGLSGFSRSDGGMCLVPLAMSAAASGDSDGSTRLSIGPIRKLFDGFPQPIKSFPWKKVISSFQNIILELVWAVAKYLSEMSYCAHDRKMGVIPIPFIVGFTLAGVLKNTAEEVLSDLKICDIRLTAYDRVHGRCFVCWFASYNWLPFSGRRVSLAFVSDCELLHITQIAWPILSILGPVIDSSLC